MNKALLQEKLANTNTIQANQQLYTALREQLLHITELNNCTLFVAVKNKKQSCYIQNLKKPNNIPGTVEHHPHLNTYYKNGPIYLDKDSLAKLVVQHVTKFPCVMQQQ